MKKSTQQKIQFLTLGFLIASLIQIFWIGITREKAEDYIYEDLEKISESRRKTKGQVLYDYFATDFHVDALTLNKLVDSIIEKDSKSYLFITYSMSKENNKYNNFNFTISSSKKEDKYEPLQDITGFSINPINRTNNPESYRKAFEIVKSENTILNKIKGHNHNFDDGVTFPIQQVRLYLDSNKTDTYYFYPALAPIIKNGKDSKDSFTTILISNDKELRQKGAKVDGAKDGNNFYGDKGTACCQ